MKKVSAIWAAEFRGFFCGEGYLGITTNGKSRGRSRGRSSYNYTARAQITQRLDDLPVLNEIQKRIGGIVYVEGRGRRTLGKKGERYTSNPYAVWRTRSMREVRAVCALLVGGVLPFRKRAQVRTIIDFLGTRMKPGPKGVAEHARVISLRENLHKKIKKMHAYAGVEG